MTKQQLQKELLEKVKPGTKPSHLKKLKRSKSEGDIPKAPPSSVPLIRGKSNPILETKYPYTTLVSQQQTIEKLEKETTAKSDTIKLLRQKIEDLEKQNPPTQLFQDQLSEKQTEIENLRQQLESKTTLTELDNSLFARHQNLKDWFTQYSKNKKLDQELSENIDEASTELLEQDKVIGNLRGQVKHLELTNQSLTKDLDLSRRLAELRKNPLPNPNSDYSNLLVYTFLAFWFISLLNSSWNRNFKDND